MVEKWRFVVNFFMLSGIVMKSEGMWILMNNIVIGYEYIM